MDIMFSLGMIIGIITGVGIGYNLAVLDMIVIQPKTKDEQ